MQSLKIYRSKNGRRLMFRSREVVSVGLTDDLVIELSTIYGSTYELANISPEVVVEDREKEDDGLHHFFHWSPTYAQA